MADPVEEYLKVIRKDIRTYWGGFFSNCPAPIKKMRDGYDSISSADERVGVDPVMNVASGVLRLASDQLKKHGFERQAGVNGQLGEYVAKTDEAKKYLKTTRGQFYFNHLKELERIIYEQRKLHEQKVPPSPSMRKK